MDDDVLSDTGDLSDKTSFEKQTETLQTYLASLPYNCESIEEMQGQLEVIVGKIYICAKAQNWLVLTTWDGLLQSWLLMRYPMPTSTRAKLVRLYYELTLLPGIEARVIRSWTDMVTRLISNKPGQKPKLEPADLQLPWRPLWRILQKELWPKERLFDPTRNILNILLYLAEQCKPYFPEEEIRNMLETFIPLITKDTILAMVPVLTSFLPPYQPDLYIPFLFKLWEAFNSNVIDERLLELAGELSEQHVAGPHGESPTEYQDIGIWSGSQWSIIVNKGLGSMNVPVGSAKTSSTTSGHADLMADPRGVKIKKQINRFQALAKVFVYSIAADGPVRDNSQASTPSASQSAIPVGYLAGSKALDSLDKLITSTESFFHPSNSGHWTPVLTSFLQHLASEFCKRVNEEDEKVCKTPPSRRLTQVLRRGFVNILKTPALLAMFSKDPISMSYTLTAIRTMAVLEPTLLMPELLERAYNGLEVVNETHRTTAVLSMLLGISRPLVTEKIWLGGQKHLLPLLELCIPGIDLNDPAKTVCATMFIVGVIQHVKIGDLSLHSAPMSDGPDDTLMQADDELLPDGVEPGMPALSRDEERSLVRDSTTGFADWVTSLFRRVIALYENLPEEGGRRNTTGGKQEENVLKSVKSMMDVVCLHLSDQLFELVLKLVFEYATTNAKSNAVKAFGQLVACLARARPAETTAKFLPFCIARIQDELIHGASSLRTTAPHTAIPSDTTLHWDLAILRGCLGYGGETLLKYKQQILDLLLLLIDKCRTERGYSGVGRLISRILHTVAGVYPLNSRFVNTEEWGSQDFERSHNIHWGKLMEPTDVVLEWHVPSPNEISFVLDVLRKILEPTLKRVETLLQTTQKWGNEDRNDFCRYLLACRSIWSGLPTFLLDQKKEADNPCLSMDTESFQLVVSHLQMEAGFTLTNPSDPRYKEVSNFRTRFGDVCRRAASSLRSDTEDEDHIDAVIGVARAIDVYLLDYGLTKSSWDSLQKNYTQARDLNRTWVHQKQNSRLVFVKRAQVYHSGRVYMHALYRRRSTLDDALIGELVELSLSPYTRVRRHSQSILRSVFGYYVRSTRSTLTPLVSALSKGNDPDRIKGALYVLGDKGIASYALSDQSYHGKYLMSLLECQHEEKPSVQKLVATLSEDCLSHLHEEAVHTDAYDLPTPTIEAALKELEEDFSPSFVDLALLREAVAKSQVRVAKRNDVHRATVSSILALASNPQTHWRYVQIACRFLSRLLRRDLPPGAGVAKFFAERTTSPQPTIRASSQRALTRLLAFLKIQQFAKSNEELWRDEWKNPREISVTISDPLNFLHTVASGNLPNAYIDKLRTGFLSYTPSIKAYTDTDTVSVIPQDTIFRQPLDEIRGHVFADDYLPKLSSLWSQEVVGKNGGGTVDLRSENVVYIKSLAKAFEEGIAEDLIAIIDPLLSDQDKYKQRAGGEFLAGLQRGSKHWSRSAREKLWEWTRTRLDNLFVQIKPDTLPFWGSAIAYLLQNRDPRRSQPLVEWVLALPLDFNGDSAFQMGKSMLVLEVLVECFGTRFRNLSDRYVNLMFDNANTNYAEIRMHIVQLLGSSIGAQWDPLYPSTTALLESCAKESDPLRTRHPKYGNRVDSILSQLALWREQRLPPPRVNQSEYDKVGLTVLLWLWLLAHGHRAVLMFPYVVAMMPEIFRMTEVNDHAELQAYSSAVLYIVSAVPPPAERVGMILDNFVSAIKSSSSWRLRLHALPALVVFFYRNLLSIPSDGISKVMDVLIDCLSDENVEVREMASKVLSGVVRCSQRQQIIPLKNRFVSLVRKTTLPARQDPAYATKLRILHSAILGICALIESFPYSVEPWMPPLTTVLAPHATDPPPISTTIRKCASEFKKTHQDTWHKDQYAFDEDQLQNLSTMLVGTSYYA